MKNEDGILSFKSEAHNFYPLDLKMNEVSRFVATDSNSFIVFEDTFDSEIEHVYSTQCNTYEKPETVMNDSFSKYNYPKAGIQYYVHTIDSNPELNTSVTDVCVQCVMTTQEPDKLCCSNFKCLKNETEKTAKYTKMFEVFTYDPEVKVVFKDDCVIIGEYVIKNGTIEKNSR